VRAWRAIKCGRWPLKLTVRRQMTGGNRDIIDRAPMATAWRHAAADLGIRFLSPFTIEHRGKTYWCTGILPDFGGPLGAVIVDRHSSDDTIEICDHAGYFASGLNPLYYETYDRVRFVSALNDWGWFGSPSDVPSWFRGGLNRHGSNR